LELDAVFFRIPQMDVIFELVHFRNTEQGVVGGSNVDVGATHIGLFVENIDEVVERLGLETAGAPMELPIGPYRGGRSVYLKDPNGANLQLMEVTRRPGGLPLP
jgi:predicted enzyme related to lactoylglutathione lyase